MLRQVRALIEDPGPLVLDDPLGPRVALSRPAPFSDTEEAPGKESTPTLRAGEAADARAVVAMHARCSADTVRRRYHVPVPHLSTRLARAVLDPPGGTSLVLTVGYDVVALGTVAPDPSEDAGRTAELGLMVEDRWQRQGLGSRLLCALAVAAARRGFETLICHVQPDNDAVMPTLHRSGLRVRASYADGLTQYRIPVSSLAGAEDVPRRRGNRPAMGEVTTGLTSLLHTRRELREIHPAADLIDQAVRGGA